MTPRAFTLAIAINVALAVVLLRLVVRGRWRLSPFFAAHVAFGVVTIPPSSPSSTTWANS